MTEPAADSLSDAWRAVGRILPGDVLLPSEVEQERAAFSAETGLGPEAIVVSSFGYPSVPRPIAGQFDGSYRLPPTLEPLAARDPTWWLDDETKSRRAGEDDELYIIRIHLELLARQLVDPESLVFHNPLRALGIDVRTPSGRARIQAYRDGGADPEICALVLGPELQEVPEEVAVIEDWSSALAEELLVTHLQAYEEVAAECQAAVTAMIAGVAAELRDADFDSASAPLEAALSAFGAGGSVEASRRGIHAALDELLDQVGSLMQDELIVRGELTLGSATVADILEYGGRAREIYESGRIDLARDADRLLGLLYGEPGPATKNRLLAFCRTAWDGAIRACQLTMDEWDRHQAGGSTPRRRAPLGAVPAAEIYGDIAGPLRPLREGQGNA